MHKIKRRMMFLQNKSKFLNFNYNVSIMNSLQLHQNVKEF